MSHNESQILDSSSIHSPFKASVDFTITLLGTQNVGKTSIAKRFVSNKYEKEYSPTLGVDCFDTKIDVNNKILFINIFDPSGQTKYKGLLVEHLKKSDAVILIYDVTDKKTLIDLEKLMQDVIKHCGKNILIHVVGNKIDQTARRQVSPEEGRNYADSIGAKFIESSAVNPTNVTSMFQTVVQWSQIKVYPGSVPAKTQMLLVKLNQSNDVDKKTIIKSEKLGVFGNSQSAIQLNASSVNKSTISLGVSNEPKASSQEDYFEQLLRKSDPQSKASKNVIKMIQGIETDVFAKIFKNQVNVTDQQVDFDEPFRDDSQQAKMIESLMKARKHKEMSQLCKEISANLLAVEEHIKSLKYDQVDENKQAQLVKKNLTQKLINLQQSESLARCEELLHNQYGNFQTSTTYQKNQDQANHNKMNVSLIIEADHFKQQEEIIKRIISDKHETDKKRLAKVKSQEDQMRIDDLKLENLRKQIQSDKNIKKREKLSVQIKEQEEREAKRKQDHIEQQLKIKEIISKKQLPDIKEDEERNLQLQNELDIRKETLKKLRDIHKPLRKDVLDERALQYDKVKSEQEEKRKLKLERVAKLSFHASYEGENYIRAKEETKHNNNFREDKIIEAREKLKAVKVFNAATREDHFPSINEAKTQELEELQKKLQHNPNFKDYIEVSRSVMKKGVFFDKKGGSKNHEVDSKHYDELLDYQSEHEEARSKGNKYLQKAGRRIKKIKTNNSQHDVKINDEDVKKLDETQSDNQLGKSRINQVRTDLKRIDYLKEVHSQLNLQRRDIHHDWEKIANKKNISNSQRDEQLYNQAKQIESEAKKKEQILKARSHKDNDLWKQESEVDSLFFSSIKAKLLVLDKNKSPIAQIKPIK